MDGSPHASEPPAPSTPPMFGRKRPAYALIGEALRGAIAGGRLPAGAVLFESALAGMFGASRSPVRQAFAALADEGLVRRFEGRGVVVGEAEADRRIPVTSGMLGLDAAMPDERDDAWTAHYYCLERDIILRSLAGPARVNEVALARHLGVGRTVARNLLVRAQGLGLVRKGGNAQWQVVPLDPTRIGHLYDLRIALEPPLLREAVGRIPRDELAAMKRRLHEAARNFSAQDITGLDALEADLHIVCPGYGLNTAMAEALCRTRCLLVIFKHIQSALPGRPGIEPFMDEHLAILMAMQDGEAERASCLLVDHLASSRDKAAQRLAVFHRRHVIETPPYMLGIRS